MNLGSFAAVLLHENKLIVSGDLGTLAPSSIHQMKLLCSGFFDSMGLFSLPSSAASNTFQEAKQVFLRAVQLDHLRCVLTCEAKSRVMNFSMNETIGLDRAVVISPNRIYNKVCSLPIHQVQLMEIAVIILYLN